MTEQIVWIHSKCGKRVFPTDRPNEYFCQHCMEKVGAKWVTIIAVEVPAPMVTYGEQPMPGGPVVQAIPTNTPTPQPVATATPPPPPKLSLANAKKMATSRGLGLGIISNWLVILSALLLFVVRTALITWWLDAPEANLSLGGNLPLWTPFGIEIPIITIAPFGKSIAVLNTEVTVTVAFGVIALLLVLKENATERTNQNPAHKNNLGLVLFFLAPMLIGWTSLIVGGFGIFLMMRHRKGITQIQQTMVGLGLAMYIFLNLVRVFLAKLFYSMEADSTVAQIIELFLQFESLRVITFAIFTISIVVSWWNKENDGTTQAVALFIMLSFYKLFGVFPFLEFGNGELIWWVIMLLLIGTMLVEVFQGGSSALFVFLLFFNLIFYLAALGFSIILEGYNVTMTANPFSISFLTLLVISMFLHYGTKSVALKELTMAITKWSGSLVHLKPIPLMVPLDAALLTFIPWIILLHLGYA